MSEQEQTTRATEEQTPDPEATDASAASDGPGGPGGPDESGLAPERFLEFLEKWSHRLAPEPEPPKPSVPALESRFSIVLLGLKVLPWVTALAYLTSLRWDFSGALPVTLFWRPNTPVVLDGLMRMLAVCGLVGFGTNWLAIKMLFYPRKKRPLLGQGLIPSRKDRIVLRLGESISKEIINSKLILKQIRKSGMVKKHREKLARSLQQVTAEPEFRKDLMDMSEYYVNGFLRSEQVQSQLVSVIRSIDFENIEGIEGGLLKLYRFFKGNDDLAEHFETVMKSVTVRMGDYEEKLVEYLDALPKVLEEKGQDLEDQALKALIFLIEQVNVKKVITENLGDFDEIRLERLLMRSTSDQLQYIQYLGCLLGIIGGLFIWQPLESFVVFGGLAGTIYGLDTLLIRMRGGLEPEARASDLDGAAGKKKDKNKKKKQPAT